MATNTIIDEAAFEYLHDSINQGRRWIVYDESQEFLERSDVFAGALEEQAWDHCLRNPSPGNRIVQVCSIADLCRRVYDPLPSIAEPLKQPFMNVKNLEYLENQLLYAGYANALNPSLLEELRSEKEEFALHYNVTIGRDQVASSLNFTRSELSDLYFFNRHTITFKKEGAKEPVKQTFYMGKGQHNITLKEGYNLLDGRAVFKENLTTRYGEQYDSWIRIDRQKITPNGNFKLRYLGDREVLDVTAEVGKFIIPALTTDELRAQLIKAIERGNEPSVTIIDNGTEKKIALQACPESGSLSVRADL